jgi:hypothetical protein
MITNFHSARVHIVNDGLCFRGYDLAMEALLGGKEGKLQVPHVWRCNADCLIVISYPWSINPNRLHNDLARKTFKLQLRITE